LSVASTEKPRRTIRHSVDGGVRMGCARLYCETFGMCLVNGCGTEINVAIASDRHPHHADGTGVSGGSGEEPVFCIGTKLVRNREAITGKHELHAAT
jgi:hypothetical protein